MKSIRQNKTLTRAHYHVMRRHTFQYRHAFKLERNAYVTGWSSCTSKFKTDECTVSLLSYRKTKYSKTFRHKNPIRAGLNSLGMRLNPFQFGSDPLRIWRNPILFGSDPLRIQTPIRFACRSLRIRRNPIRFGFVSRRIRRNPRFEWHLKNSASFCAN
jgi:hypothetical protein